MGNETQRRRHALGVVIVIRPTAATVLSLVLLTGCGSAAVSQHQAGDHAASAGAGAATPSNADPNRAADTALCNA
jgi:hypothetical protein